MRAVARLSWDACRGERGDPKHLPWRPPACTVARTAGESSHSDKLRKQTTSYHSPSQNNILPQSFTTSYHSPSQYRTTVLHNILLTTVLHNILPQSFTTSYHSPSHKIGFRLGHGHTYSRQDRHDRHELCFQFARRGCRVPAYLPFFLLTPPVFFLPACLPTSPSVAHVLNNIRKDAASSCDGA